MEEKRFFVTDVEGNEVEYEIILTFESPETGKNYVIYKLPQEEENVLAAIYEEDDDKNGTLVEIETEAEYEMIESVLNAFLDEDESEE